MNLNLRQRLVLLVLLAVVPLVAIVGYNLFHLFDDLQTANLEESSRDAEHIALSLNDLTNQLIREGEATGFGIVHGRLSPIQADRYLDDVRRHAPLPQITFIRPNGRVYSTSLPALKTASFAGDDAFTRVASGRDSAVTSIRGRKGLALALAVFSRIDTGRTLHGVSLATVDANELGGTIPAEVTDGTIIVTDDRGRLMYSNSRAIVRAAGSRPLDDFAFVNEARQGRDFTVTSTRLPGVSGRYLGAQVPVPRVGWTAGVFRPSGEAFAHVFEETAVTVGVILAVLFATLLATRFYGIRWISDPVTNLAQVSSEIGRGNFDVKIDVRSRDELGLLADSLRSMQRSLRHTFADAERLREAARHLNSSLEPISVASVAVDYLREVLNATDVIVTDLESEPSPRILASTLEPAAAQHVSFLLSRPAAEPELTKSGWAIVRVNEELAGRLGETMRAPRFVVILPLVVAGRLSGRIDVFTTPTVSLSEFEHSDVALAGGFAQQVAIALENARLFERQRRIADTLQESLLTKPYPVPGIRIGLVYRPAVGGKVGGDFYDFIPAKGGKTAVVIGDISGSGIEAARLTSVAKGAIRSFALESPLPAFVLARANRVITEQVDLDSFITVVYVLMDPATGNLEYSIAGHPPPLLLHRRLGEVVRFNPGSLPLGIDERAVYSNQRLNMAPEDKLVLYTDGLSEARRGRRLFGEERIAQSLQKRPAEAAQQAADWLVQEAVDFSKGRIADDLAVIVLERERIRQSRQAA